MLYDYIVTQFYPNIYGLVFLHVILLLAVLAFYFMRTMWLEDYKRFEDRDKFVKRWGRKVSVFSGFQIFALMFYFLIPDVDYVKHFYGEVRVVEITPEQKAELQAQYDKHYARSERLFIECLKSGQKQPHTTTFNDTNEVVKTCYKVAQYKF